MSMFRVNAVGDGSGEVQMIDAVLRKAPGRQHADSISRG
jgi:hypothetical protein